MRMSRLKSLLLSLFADYFTSSCGQAGKASQIEITVLPKEPPVITGNFKLPNDQIVTQPWFRFTVKVCNNSDEALTIIGLKLNVLQAKSNGSLITKVIN